MAIVIRGFDQQKIITAAEVAKQIQMLPKAHIVGLRSILFKTERELRSLNIHIDKSCQGAYYPDYRSIMIHSFSSKDDCIHILLHEIGHYVFHTVIDSYQRKQWVTSVFPGSHFISSYAATNSEEDFAECYAEFAKNSEMLRRIPTKYTFMRQQVFRQNRAVDKKK